VFVCLVYAKQKYTYLQVAKRPTADQMRWHRFAMTQPESNNDDPMSANKPIVIHGTAAPVVSSPHIPNFIGLLMFVFDIKVTPAASRQSSSNNLTLDTTPSTDKPVDNTDTTVNTTSSTTNTQANQQQPPPANQVDAQGDVVPLNDTTTNVRRRPARQPRRYPNSSRFDIVVGVVVCCLFYIKCFYLFMLFAKFVCFSDEAEGHRERTRHKTKKKRRGLLFLLFLFSHLLFFLKK